MHWEVCLYKLQETNVLYVVKSNVFCILKEWKEMILNVIFTKKWQVLVLMDMLIIGIWSVYIVCTYGNATLQLEICIIIILWLWWLVDVVVVSIWPKNESCVKNKPQLRKSFHQLPHIFLANEWFGKTQPLVGSAASGKVVLEVLHKP